MSEPKPYSLEERNYMLERRQSGKRVAIDLLRFEATIEQARQDAIRQIAVMRAKLPTL